MVDDTARKHLMTMLWLLARLTRLKSFCKSFLIMPDLTLINMLEIDERLFRPHEVPLLLGDATKAKEKLGWEPKVNFEGLAKMMYDEDLKELIK